MVEVICDNCGAVKKTNREWVLGYKWENRSRLSGSVRQLIRFFDHWYVHRATEPGAIHLCSLECKEAYANKNGLRIIITQRDFGVHSY
jgi:hypothetical protein